MYRVHINCREYSPDYIYFSYFSFDPVSRVCSSLNTNNEQITFTSAYREDTSDKSLFMLC